MVTRTLRDTVADADDARFVGRSAERRVVADLFDDATPSRILYVYGPGGIGKSTLVRHAAREAKRSGFHVDMLDTRVGSQGLEASLGRFGEDQCDPRCVVLDEADLLGSELEIVRDRLVDELSASARIIFAGRRPPAPSWRTDGLDSVLVDLALLPLPEDEADQLLDAHGVEHGRIAEIIAWAQGSPLALTVAALTPPGPQTAPIDQTLEARLTSWLAGSSSLGVATDVLDVAAVAPVVDARLIAAALPGRATRDAMTRLTALPVVEMLGDRAVLHPVLASVITSRLAARTPERYRSLKKRIVEHLGARARLGDMTALIELSQFISDGPMRRAISNHPSPSLFTDVPGPGELVDFAADQGFDQGPDWSELFEFQSHGAPYRLVVRRSDRSIVLYGSFARGDAIAPVGAVTRSLDEAMASAGVDPARTFVGVVCFADASTALRGDAARLGTGALMHLHGIPDMQAVLIHFPQPDRRPLEIVSALSGPLHADLQRPVAISDYRPDGAVGFVEAVVLAELGFSAPPGDLAGLLALDADPDRQARLHARLDVVFDESEADQRLRKVIELVHLGPRQSEREALESIHVSRRTWFRLLRQARERVLDPNI